MSIAKRFDEWNLLKKSINGAEMRRNLFFAEREVWWCSLGINVGVESNGKNQRFERPVLIVKKFNGEMIWVVPLTSKPKYGPYFTPVTFGGAIRWACTSQLKTISTKRLLRKMDVISTDDFLKVSEEIAYCIINGPRFRGVLGGRSH